MGKVKLTEEDITIYKKIHLDYACLFNGKTYDWRLTFNNIDKDLGKFEIYDKQSFFINLAYFLNGDYELVGNDDE